MTENNFEHRQGSVYVSKDKLYDTEITFLIRKMAKKMFWLEQSVKSLDVTDVGERYSLLELLLNSEVEI